MKTATIAEIKQEMHSLQPQRLLELTLRLAKFKKENKELLTYLLFESHDEEAYIQSVKNWMDEAFIELPKANLYLTKKSLRKILRITSRYIRYTGSAQMETALLIYFCLKMKTSGIPYHKSQVLLNLFEHQLKKIKVVIKELHEDLQYDFQNDMAFLLDENQ